MLIFWCWCTCKNGQYSGHWWDFLFSSFDTLIQFKFIFRMLFTIVSIPKQLYNADIIKLQSNWERVEVLSILVFFWSLTCKVPLSRWGHCWFSVELAHVVPLSLFFFLLSGQNTSLRWGWRWLIQLYFSFQKIKRKKDESEKMLHAESARIGLVLSDMSKIQFQIKRGFLSMP